MKGGAFCVVRYDLFTGPVNGRSSVYPKFCVSFEQDKKEEIIEGGSGFDQCRQSRRLKGPKLRICCGTRGTACSWISHFTAEIPYTAFL